MKNYSGIPLQWGGEMEDERLGKDRRVGRT